MSGGVATDEGQNGTTDCKAVANDKKLTDSLEEGDVQTAQQGADADFDALYADINTSPRAKDQAPNSNEHDTQGDVVMSEKDERNSKERDARPSYRGDNDSSRYHSRDHKYEGSRDRSGEDSKEHGRHRDGHNGHGEEDRDQDTRRDKDRDRGRDKEKSREKDRERDRDRDRDRDRERDRDRDRGRDRDRERDRDRDRDRDRERDRDRDRDRARDRDRDKHRDRRSDRDRDRDRRSDKRGYYDEDDSRYLSERRHKDSYGRDRDDHRSRVSERRSRDRDTRSRYGERSDDDRDRRRYGDRDADRHDRSRWEERREERRETRRDERREQSKRNDLVLGGYKPRQRSSGAVVPQAMDPFAAVRAKNAAQGLSLKSQEEVERARSEQQAKARQMVLQQQAISTAAAASKTQREVYIGNLQQGKVTEQTLRQLFDEALSTTFPHLLTPGVKPCLSVAMHSEGRYAFVELATPEMATAALQLSGQLNFLGSQMTVGRPSGYIDPAKAAAAAAAASKALQEFSTESGDVAEVLAQGEAPPICSQPTPCLCIDHMVGPSVFTDEVEYQELVEDLHEECSKYGTVVDTRIPRPGRDADPEQYIGQGCYGKVYCLMDSMENAVVIRNVFNGRVYDGRALTVSFIHPAHFCMLSVPEQVM